MAIAAPLLLGAGPAGRLDVSLLQLRSDSGHVRLCLTRTPAFFPNCKADPQARKLSAAAADGASLSFANLPSGDYALSVIHDENDNARLDTFAGIPREGFGFSRDPAVRFGPPSFAQARFAVGAETVSQQVRMRYIF